MTRPFRVLTEECTSSDSSDFVVILAVIAIARCSCLRRLHLYSTSPSTQPHLPSSAANKALKKKVLRSLPKLIATAELAVKFCLTDCTICLSEFAAGDEIRVLPQCGHGFHVSCIDAWLKSHSSCPSDSGGFVVPEVWWFPCLRQLRLQSAAPPETDPEARFKIREREKDANMFCLS